jgi:hypothetical protein
LNAGFKCGLDFGLKRAGFKAVRHVGFNVRLNVALTVGLGIR